MAAEYCTVEKVTFMIRYTSGLICAPILPDRAEALDLPPMVIENRDPHRTAYTVTVDSVAVDSIATCSVTTGISAHDRALTVRTLANAQSTSASFRRPGHVLPLIAKPGGVRQRRGHTEAALELCRLAGKAPAAVISEVVVEGDETGRPELLGAGMMRRDGLLAFGKKWGIKVCTIEDMVIFVEKKEGKLKA
jgi:3,4-dihydroxy 2-butanone 4-phosphate synthase